MYRTQWVNDCGLPLSGDFLFSPISCGKQAIFKWNDGVVCLVLVRPNTLSSVFRLQAHWNNSPGVNNSFHLHTLSGHRANQYLLFLLNPACNTVCLAERQQIPNFMVFGLTRPMFELSWIFIVLPHWNNSLRVYMLLHSCTLSWFRTNQLLLLLLNTACLRRSREYKFHSLWFDPKSDGGLELTIYRTQYEHANHYIIDEVWLKYKRYHYQIFGKRHTHWSTLVAALGEKEYVMSRRRLDGRAPS